MDIFTDCQAKRSGSMHVERGPRLTSLLALHFLVHKPTLRGTKPNRSAAFRQTPGGFMTCTGTSWNGVWTYTITVMTARRMMDPPGLLMTRRVGDCFAEDRISRQLMR